MENTINFLNTLSKEVHQNAVEHGWWEEERNFGEIIALIHSELSEALEEYRNGHAVTEIYYNGDKPEGVPVELADVVIRILDYIGSQETYLDTDYQIYQNVHQITGYGYAKGTFGDFIARQHRRISDSYFGDCEEQAPLIKCIAEIECWFSKNGLDFESTIQLKHEYNKTRPYKHGGKII